MVQTNSAGSRVARLALDMGPVADTIILRGNGLASTVELLAGIVDHGEERRHSISDMPAPSR
ncbi:MAG: hypothetical protein IPF59_14115 [Ignavibacteria bacterium]|nr:hypothetical protein [Ignavibacteria bacterium]